MWQTDLLTEFLAAALHAEERRRIDEQAVYGLDSLEEVGLHPLLAAGLSTTGFGVLREQEYPHEWRKKRTGEGDDLPVRRDRQRCDIVLTPREGQTLRDPVRVLKSRRTAKKQAAGSLFEAAALATIESEAAAPPPPNLAAPEECYWLEIKLVSQFCYTTGVPGPNRAYASELTRHIPADLRKLADDGRIDHAGVCLVHFTDSEATAEHDLVTLMHRCLDRGLSVLAPSTRRFPVADRIGNRLCSVSLIGVRRS